MELIDITNLTDEQLEILLRNVSNEAKRREEEKLLEAEKAFYKAARALYSLDHWYEFPVSASDLETEDYLTLGMLLELTGQKMKKS